MKTAIAVLACFVAVVAADTEPLPVTAIEASPAPSAAPNATAAPRAQIQARQEICSQPSGAAERWYRLNKGDGPHTCHLPPLSRKWSMLRSYRDGGVQNVHWKYTDDMNDPECMFNWNYHAADGRTLKTYVPGRTTTYGLNRRWCGLPVYNDGGVQGFQWDYCPCSWVDFGPKPLSVSEAPSPVRD